MPRFIYTSQRVDKPRDPFIRRRVRVWRVTAKGGMATVGEETACHETAWQLAVGLLVRHKALPAKLRDAVPGRADLLKAGVHIFCLSED